MSRVLAMGPGRSATHWIANILRTSWCMETVHEEKLRFSAPLKHPIEEADWDGAGDWLTEKDNRALVGFPYGLMVHYLRHRVPNLRVICIHREKKEWLHSARGWQVNKATNWPTGLTSKEEYWEIYNHLMRSITPPLLRLKMDASKPFGAETVVKIGRFING